MRYIILTTTVCLVALAHTAMAGVYNSSDSSLSMSPVTTEEPVLLASTGFDSTTASETGLAESGDQLAEALIQPTDIPRPSLSVLPSEHPELGPIREFANAEKKEKSIEQRLAEISNKRSGFSLNGLFSGSGQADPSLGSLFLSMAFIGLVVGGIRLEILRRRAEKAAFYGTELAQHRSRRPRSTVIYVETPRRSSSSHASSEGSHRRRRRRRRSSHSEHGHSDRRRRSSYQSTHPVTIEGRLAS